MHPPFLPPLGLTDPLHQRGNFLVSISGPICRTKSPVDSRHLLHQIRDAVVQDANDSEGTGVWANLQAVSSHVAAPSLTSAHYLRIASADINQRAAINAAIGSASPSSIDVPADRRPQYLEKLRQAVYLTTLLCFIQGLEVMERENEREGWGVDVLSVLRVWRAGCIIKSDYISDLLESAYEASGPEARHPLCRPAVADDVKKNWASLKDVVVDGARTDAHVPCLSASLEYLKYVGGTDLPTSFIQAQLDSFGAHGFDLKSEPVRHLQKGKIDDVKRRREFIGRGGEVGAAMLTTTSLQVSITRTGQAYNLTWLFSVRVKNYQ